MEKITLGMLERGRCGTPLGFQRNVFLVQEINFGYYLKRSSRKILQHDVQRRKKGTDETTNTQSSKLFVIEFFQNHLV